jgi:hypothetical protein
VTVYHFHTNSRTGQVVLSMEAPCGSNQAIGWQGLEDMRQFADMILDFYWQRKMEKLHIDDVSENLIHEALDDDGSWQ